MKINKVNKNVIKQVNDNTSNNDDISCDSNTRIVIQTNITSIRKGMIICIMAIKWDNHMYKNKKTTRIY